MDGLDDDWVKGKLVILLLSSLLDDSSLGKDVESVTKAQTIIKVNKFPILYRGR